MVKLEDVLFVLEQKDTFIDIRVRIAKSLLRELIQQQKEKADAKTT